jgi:hypothetical protein
MADLKEHVCIKFFLFSRKQQHKLSQCFARLLKKKLRARLGFTNGFLGSNVVACHLKTNHDMGLLQQAEPTKIFKKFADECKTSSKFLTETISAETS